MGRRWYVLRVAFKTYHSMDSITAIESWAYTYEVRRFLVSVQPLVDASDSPIPIVDVGLNIRSVFDKRSYPLSATSPMTVLLLD